MHASLTVSISLLICGVLGIALAIQMLLDQVPRNQLYGFRTKLTLSSDEIWYPANRFAAKGLIVWGLINVIAGAFSFALHPMSGLIQSLLVIPPMSICLFFPCAAVWMNRKYRKTAS